MNESLWFLVTGADYLKVRKFSMLVGVRDMGSVVWRFPGL